MGTALFGTAVFGDAVFGSTSSGTCLFDAYLSLSDGHDAIELTTDTNYLQAFAYREMGTTKEKMVFVRKA